MPRAAQTHSSGHPKGTKSKQKKRSIGDEMGEVPEVDEQAAAHAAARAQKKQKKAAAQEAEVADDDEEQSQAGDDEPASESPEVAAARMRRRREHKRVAGYRSKAVECGFIPNAGVAAAGGADVIATALTSADARRCMRFYPEVLNKCSYGKAECAARMKLSQEKVPESAAREAQGRLEAVMRKFMNQAVLRTAEKGAMRVDAATMLAVLRPYHYSLEFTSLAPAKGLVRHAQASGVLEATTADADVADEEKIENRELSAAAKRMDKDEADRKEAFKLRRDQLKIEREQVKAAN